MIENLSTPPIDVSQHPEGTMRPLPRVDNLTEAEFVNNYLRKCQPVIITNATSNWKAMQTWSYDYFRSLDSEFTVTLEEGNVMQGKTTFREISFRDYLTEIETAPATTQRAAYLAVFELFKHFPQLADDVDFSLMANQKLINHTAGWIGPAGTVTGYHIDWADNMFVQVVGQKFIKVVSPDQRKRMYPSSKYDSNTLMSSVDADNYDAERYPEFANVDAMYAIVQPGEMLFNPRGWWHYVRSLGPSISVNNFGIDWKSFFRDKPREYSKKYLHRIGLYGKECTCHMMVDGKRVARRQ